MKNRKKKMSIGLLSLALLMVIAVGGTLAALVANTNPLVNTFEPAEITSRVEETVEGDTKKDVKLQNTGNIDAYIRAVVTVNLVDDAGNVYMASADQYTMDPATLPASGWISAGGYYYYTASVAANGYTANLINSCKPVSDKIPEGQYLQVTILGEAIQTNAVSEIWTAVKVGQTGLLEVK